MFDGTLIHAITTSAPGYIYIYKYTVGINMVIETRCNLQLHKRPDAKRD